MEEILEKLIYNTRRRDGKPNELEIPQRKMFALVKVSHEAVTRYSVIR